MLNNIIYLILILHLYVASAYNGVAPTLTMSNSRQIPQLGIGTWLGWNSKETLLKPTNNYEVENAVKWAIDAGYRHIDTAHVYSTEEQVGAAVNKKIAEGCVNRSDLFITTKLWNDKHGKDQVVPALKESLSGLKLDYVDLYLIHWPIAQQINGTYDNIDYVETWQGMLEAKRLGLAKSIGVSNFNQQQLDRILASSDEKPQVLQIELNLNLQQPELRAYCKKHGILVTAYTPFGSLFSSKAKPDAPPPRIDDPTLQNIAAKYKKTVPQIVLRYLVELDVIPIPKTVTKERVEQNIAVFDFHLTDDEKDTLKAYDKSYRTINPSAWKNSPYYPF